MNRDDAEGLSRLSAALLAAERRSPAPPARLQRSIWRRTRRTLLASGVLLPGLVLGKASAAALATKIVVALGLAAIAALGVRAVLAPGTPPREGAAEHGPSQPTSPREAGRGRASEARPDEGKRPASRPRLAAAPSMRASALTRERRQVDRARAALAAGSSAAALRLLERHRRAFPAGVFVEEREAMLIITLARSGRRAQARQQALAFGARFPGSVFSERIAAALAGP